MKNKTQLKAVRSFINGKPLFGETQTVFSLDGITIHGFAFKPIHPNTHYTAWELSYGQNIHYNFGYFRFKLRLNKFKITFIIYKKVDGNVTYQITIMPADLPTVKVPRFAEGGLVGDPSIALVNTKVTNLF